MSKTSELETMSLCANCGKGEEAGIKLKACTACKLVKYCNRECQIAHRPQHKKDCKKRVKELHDEKLFKQPPPLEDCPICFIRLPTLNTGWEHQTCCGKRICSGCIHAPVYDNQGNVVDKQKCAFCRAPYPTLDEALERDKKRIEVGDAIVIYNLGSDYFHGSDGYPQDHAKALELWHRSAELGNARAYCSIGVCYDNGHGVEVDKKKADRYYELAAMGGDDTARRNLGVKEVYAGNKERAIKHFMIATRDGDSNCLDKIKAMYQHGDATKDDYTKALQLYQAYLGEIKSVHRENAAATAEDEYYRYY